MTKLVAAVDAANALGWPYQTLMTRIRRGQVKAHKLGPAVFIDKSELSRHANHGDMVKAARQVVLPRKSDEDASGGEA